VKRKLGLIAKAGIRVIILKGQWGRRADEVESFQ
jgi:hypothetical protein